MNRILLLSLVLFALGCNQPAPPVTPSVTQPDTPTVAAGHSHGSGPHGGPISDWGGGAYHFEFTVDHDKKEATVHILGATSKRQRN